jgi:hypothetical protein
MGNLWVATLQDGWIRADQIVYVGAQKVHWSRSADAGKVEVVVRLATATGSWSWNDDVGGSGDMGLDSYVLARCDTFATANHLAGLVLIKLVSLADRRAVLRIENGKVEVRADKAWSETSAGDADGSGR